MISRRHVHVLAAFAVVFVLALSMVGTLKPSSQAAAYSGVSVDIDSPTFASTHQKVLVTIIVVGGPATDVGGNYTYKDVAMTGRNTTGWDIDKETQTSDNGVFKFNLTMPGEADQKVKISLNAISTEWRTGNEENTTASFEIRVVEPIVITAEVFNNGNVDAVNATARFYGDGVLLATQVFNVTAGSSEIVSHNWTFSSISDGKHVITVTIDDPNNLVEFSDGNNMYTMTIYVGDEGNPAGIILSVGLIIVVIIFVLTYLQKPAKRGKKL